MPETEQGWVVQKYALYDFAHEKFASTVLFESRDEAIHASHSYDNVVVVPVPLKAVTAAASC